MTIESQTALAWATQVLTADATFMGLVPGGVHTGLAPQGTLSPVCTLWLNDGVDYNTFNGVAIWNDAALMVKLYGRQDDFPTAVIAARRAYVLLQRQTGGAQGGLVLACIRLRDFTVAEKLVNGVQWLSRVQIFRTLNA